MTHAAQTDFPQLMRSWRAKAGISQLELSLRCDVSQKHISFLETARNSPSQAMVLSICDALNVPLRDRNGLLVAAGYAPRYRESDFDDPQLEMVNKALDMILANHDPYPAMVVDPLYNIMRANQGGARLTALLFDCTSMEDLPDYAGNMMRSLFHPDGFRSKIRNWEEIAVFILRRLQGDLYTHGGPPELAQLIDEVSRYEGVPKNWRHGGLVEWQAPMLTFDMETTDGTVLSFFTTLSTLGTPQDIALQEIRIESLFPANEETERFLRGN